METPDPETVLGACTFCGETVTDRYVIIEYGRESGELGVWAECPGCHEIVDPTSRTS